MVDQILAPFLNKIDWRRGNLWALHAGQCYNVH